jgi:hypothetical protein
MHHLYLLCFWFFHIAHELKKNYICGCCFEFGNPM